MREKAPGWFSRSTSAARRPARRDNRSDATRARAASTSFRVHLSNVLKTFPLRRVSISLTLFFLCDSPFRFTCSASTASILRKRRSTSSSRKGCTAVRQGTSLSTVFPLFPFTDFRQVDRDFARQRLFPCARACVAVSPSETSAGRSSNNARPPVVVAPSHP